MTWPEYPEEPTGFNLFSSLRKAWSPLIPADVTRQLLPERGIKKQDDGMGGCTILSRAIAHERSGNACVIIDQLGMILKWGVFVLCSKESTVGLQAILSFFSELFDYLRERKHELSDSETLHLLPFLFDKASVAKVGWMHPCCFSRWCCARLS